MKPAILIALLLAAPSARAFDPWTWQDSAWEAAAWVVMAVDYGQTRDAVWQTSHQVRNGRVYPAHSEGNPLLGAHPSQQAVNAYFLSAAVLHAGVSAMLPYGWRRVWQASTIGLELAVIHGNAQANLSIRF